MAATPHAEAAAGNAAIRARAGLRVRRRFVRFALILGLLGGGPAAAPARAQQDAAVPEVVYFDALEVGRGESFDVDLYVRAETRTGQSVSLPAQPPWPFVLRQDGVPIDPTEVRVLPVGSEARGIASVVVLDVSPTMTGVFERARGAVLSFMDQLGPADSMALVTASGEPIVQAGFATSLDEMRVIVEGLAPETEPLPTRLLDAIQLGLERMRGDGALPPRRFVLVISDGSDGGSARTLDELVAAAAPGEDVRIPVYGVVMRDPAFGARPPELLETLSSRTGGGTLLDASLTAAFYDQLWRRMRGGHVLRYTASMDGARHSVELIMDGVVAPAVRSAQFPVRIWLVPWLVAGAVTGVVVLLALGIVLRRRRRTGCLVLVGSRADGFRFPLRRGLNEIGSVDENDVVLPSAAVSRYHAILRVGRRGVEIEDRQSTNGTFVNDKPVTVSPILVGDRIRVGDVELWYRR